MRKTLAAALLLTGLAAPALAEVPKVLVSIKPLHSLVAAVMEGMGEPGLIVSGTASPHGYAMKPSDARAAEKAKLVVWVGPALESWLDHTMAKRQDGLAMLSLPGLIRLDTREGGAWEPDHHDHGGHHAHGQGDETDPHVWLDPRNAAILVVAVSERLGALDPDNAQRYAANAQTMKRRLAELDAHLAARLAPVAKRPYVVFHDAHQYFEARYGLSPAGAITVDPERPPGAKRMAQLRDRLKTSGAACVFGEPGAPKATATMLAEASGARLGQLDPEGLLVAPGKDSYVQQMQGLASALAECLAAR
ncbi:Zinc ABC transporter periplasmic-binding protein ZnuA [Paramagnetospirillum magnetotacticum MS-1]|uniref:High-affinity zinc uptake system protein ZnuA n=1 Tax=Paramagnetospirillum magnetotacticum MS-1 TaxID=272627 RepID=A0A0C2YUF1_PARME|nr:zinc ABC transporter substrate-binding protein [Paramagnetospirillum magnetotacticum]KIL98753.1 Zinc ABC transporter periplasmic-binding protein ZnuA [Paramagnetospirillum magnetotacticum MS-1]